MYNPKSNIQLFHTCTRNISINKTKIAFQGNQISQKKDEKTGLIFLTERHFLDQRPPSKFLNYKDVV